MAAQAEYYEEEPRPRDEARPDDASLRASSSIVPADSISGRARMASALVMRRAEPLRLHPDQTEIAT